MCMKSSLLEEQWTEQFEVLTDRGDEMSCAVKVKTVMRPVAQRGRKLAYRTVAGLVMMGIVTLQAVID